MSSVGSFADAALDKRVSLGVERVEEMLAARAHSPEPLVAEAAAHLLLAGGKRFRPLLVMICAASLALPMAVANVAGSATWLIALAALPPGCAQSALGMAAGKMTSRPAMVGSTTTSAWLDNIGTRVPTVGVRGPPSPLNMLQPDSAMAASDTAAVSVQILRGADFCMVIPQSLWRRQGAQQKR